MSEDTFEIVSSYFASAEKLGDAGEAVTANELRSLGFSVVRNLYFPYNNHYTEVDIIAVSKYGVFVVENKNYAGEILGDVSDKYWYVRYSLLNERRLLNPVIQNNMHVNALEKLKILKGLVPDNYIFSPVIFNDKCKLNVTNADKKVFTLERFSKVYKEYIKDKKPLLSDGDVFKIYNILKKYSDYSGFMKVLHVLSLKGG